MDEFLKHMEEPIVLVRVGSGQTIRDFKIPKGLLCKQSQWFRSALKSDTFQEGKTGVINLPDDTPGAFTSFFYYIHTERLAFPEVDVTGSNVSEELGQRLRNAMEAWIFADKYKLPHMQDCAMSALCDFLSSATHRVPTLKPEYLELSFTKTAEGSSLRMLVADYLVTRIDSNKNDIGQVVSTLAILPGVMQALHEAQSFHYAAVARDGKLI
ncbi:putative BTB/POZ domain-containing protein [Septoria linicola]|nr:putative BTB/POZ domain-containing protein [Septoria linicola]